MPVGDLHKSLRRKLCENNADIVCVVLPRSEWALRISLIIILLFAVMTSDGSFRFSCKFLAEAFGCRGSAK